MARCNLSGTGLRKACHIKWLCDRTPREWDGSYSAFTFPAGRASPAHGGRLVRGLHSVVMVLERDNHKEKNSVTLAAAISGAGLGGTPIWDCLGLDCVKIISFDDCPATAVGVAAGIATCPCPVIATPPHGWDSIDKENDDPNNGIQADERVPDTLKAPANTDDAKASVPWSHTLDEETGKAGSGCDSTVRFIEYVRDVLKDEPVCVDPNHVVFSAKFLVTES